MTNIALANYRELIFIFKHAMKPDIKHLITILWCLFISLGHAQQSAYTMLKQDYPQLLQKFGNELKAQKANYVFAVDVSGTMNKYENIVVPAMSQFVESLSDGDNVNIIRFGTDAKVSVGGFCDINASTRQSLKQYIRSLYKRDEDLYRYTDLNRLLQTLNKQLQIQKNNLTFIFVLTDFIDDPTKGNPRLNEALSRMHEKNLSLRGIDHLMYMYALQLPVKQTNQLKLFRSAIPANYHFEEISITSPHALKNWFDRKKAEIQLDRFRAVVQRTNLPLQVVVTPKIDIDGNIKVNAEWQPNQLFDTLIIERITLLTDSLFRIESKGKLPITIHQPALKDIKAGRICHTQDGFHHLNDTLCFATALPTSYDNELQKLEIEKNCPTVQAKAEKWLFSCILPLWLCILLVLLTLIYIGLACKAAIRNRSSRWKLNGTLEVTYSGQVIAKYEMTGEKEIGVGCQGKPVAISAYNCDWQLRFYQKTFSCWKYWKKPVYKVTMEQGEAIETANGFFPAGEIATIAKGDFVQIGQFAVTWN